MKRFFILVLMVVACICTAIAQNDRNNGMEQVGNEPRQGFPGGQNGFPGGQGVIPGGGFPGFPPGGPGGPGGPWMMDFKAIDNFGVEFNNEFLVENEEVIVDKNDSTSFYFVESQRFDHKIFINYSGNDIEVKGIYPDCMKLIHDGADVSIKCEGANMEFELSGMSDDGSFTISSDKSVKIVLNGLDLKSKKGDVIKTEGKSPTYIVLAKGSTNSLEDKFTAVVRETQGFQMPSKEDNYEKEIINGIEVRKSVNRAKAKNNEPKTDGVITSNGILCFSGNGLLNLKGHNKNGIKSKQTIVMRAGNQINIEVTQGKGLSAKGDILIYGGVLNVDGSDSGKDGIRSDNCIYISGGRTVVKASGAESSEGIEAKYNIIISGGTVEVASFDDGINSGGNLIVSGGKLFVSSVFNDALDSNSNLIISGGHVVAYGGGAPECGLDANEEEGYSLYINGGTVFSCGGMPTRTDKQSRQSSIIYTPESVDSGMVYSLEDSKKSFMLMRCIRKYDRGGSLLFSSPGLETGKSYEIHTGNSNTSAAEFHGTWTDGKTGGKKTEIIEELTAPYTMIGNEMHVPGPMPMFRSE